MGKKDSGIICDGHIDTEKIYATHRQIKEIVESYKDVNLEVSQITKKIKENWVGKGRNEFESQYNLLIKKIDDFGDTLQDIYDALVEAEAEYETSDDGLRQEFVKAIESWEVEIWQVVVIITIFISKRKAQLSLMTAT